MSWKPPGVDEIKVRTRADLRNPLRRLCAKCYGRDLGRGAPGQPGRSGGRHRRAVDRRARYPADHAYLPHRWCGVAARAAAVERRSQDQRCDPLQQQPMRYVTNDQGRAGGDFPFRRNRRSADERSRARASQGALRRGHFRDGKADEVKAGTILAKWDPLTRPIITEIRRSGEVRERGRRPDRRPSRSTK